MKRLNRSFERDAPRDHGKFADHAAKGKKKIMALTIVREKREELVSKYGAVGKVKSPRPLAGKGNFSSGTSGPSAERPGFYRSVANRASSTSVPARR